MNTPLKSASRGGWRIFRWPSVIGLASVVGLVSALVGDGWHDLLSWLLLGGCVTVMIAAWRVARE